MLENGSAVAIALLLASTEQSEQIDWSTVRTWLEGVSPYPWLTALIAMGILGLLFLLNVGDQLSGILSWLGVPSPLQRSQPSTDQLEHTRQQLLRIVKKEVDRRLATSLHNLVKLDLYMEDQRQQVGKSQLEKVSEDNPKFSIRTAINRILRLKGNEQQSSRLKSTQKIIEVFEQPEVSGKLLILGKPGSGKTTELLQLAQDLVAWVEEDENQPVPVILELSSWGGESIDKWVTSQLKKLYNLSVDTTQQWLVDNQILLLLDGLDELELTKQRQCIEKINQFLETTRTTELVVCCRREEYEAGQIELDGLNGAVYLEALKEDQIRQYFEELNRLSLWENVKGNPMLLELAEKPLFLFMLVVAYQGNSIRNEHELFDAYIAKQLHNPSNQGTYKPGKEPTPNQTTHYLVWLAKQLEAVGETEFLIEGLQPTWLSSTMQTGLYKLIVGLSIALFFVLIVGLIVGLITGLNTRLGDGLISGLLFGLLGGVSTGMGTGLSAFRIEPQEKLQWSFYSGLLFGLAGGLLGGLIYGLRYGLSSGLSSGLLFGIIAGLVGGLSSISITEKATPNQGIRKSIQNALRGGLTSGLMVGLPFGLLFGLRIWPMDHEQLGGWMDGLAAGLMVGLMFGLVGGLVSGLNAAIKHFILRIFLTKNGNAPWNYARFLDHAVKHRFIQRTGGRYRFVHDLLRKHFAAMPLE